MIQKETLLKVVDNSGVKIVKCIQIFNKKVIGKKIKVSIKELKSNLNLKVKKKALLLGIIFREKKNQYRKDGYFIFFNDNAIALLNNQNYFLGSRITGPIFYKLRNNKILKSIFLNNNIFN